MPELFLDDITIAQDKHRKQLAKILSSSHSAKNVELIKLWKALKDTIITVESENIFKKIKDSI